MNDQLRSLLAYAAAGARNYADPEQVHLVARRQRNRRRLAVVGAIATVVWLGTVAYVALKPADQGPAQAEGGKAPVLVSTDYPPMVSAPTGAPALPTDRVGAASFIYAPCVNACDPFLVLPNGTQYALPSSPTATEGYALSPDGRWLGHGSAQGFRLRDLDSAASSDISDSGPGVSSARAWSPDSKWVLLARHTDATTHHYEAVNLRTGQRHRVPGASLTPLAINNNGALLSLEPGGVGAWQLVTADVSSGTVVSRREVALDLRSLVHKGETVRTERLFLGPDGRAVLAVNAQALDNAEGRTSALLLLDVADGRAVRRLELPVSDRTSGEGIWDPHAALPGGIMLERLTPSRTELVQLDDIAGDWDVVSKLPRQSQVVLRGARRY